MPRLFRKFLIVIWVAVIGSLFAMALILNAFQASPVLPQLEAQRRQTVLDLAQEILVRDGAAAAERFAATSATALTLGLSVSAAGRFPTRCTSASMPLSSSLAADSASPRRSSEPRRTGKKAHHRTGSPGTRGFPQLNPSLTAVYLRPATLVSPLGTPGRCQVPDATNGRERMISVNVTTPRPADRRNRQLWAELLTLFVGAPVILAVFLPPSAMFPMLFAVTVLGIILLHRTPGFTWRDLARGWGRIDWTLVAVFALTTTLVSAAVMAAVLPDRWFVVWRMSPWMWLAIMVLYPFVSALPQEVVFRPLFFRRYAPILPGGRAALVLNAALFSLAHLLYWNWIVAAMTFAGGLAFGWAYEIRRSFPLAVALHAVAGNILFTVGTGMLFYTGAIVRPF